MKRYLTYIVILFILVFVYTSFLETLFLYFMPQLLVCLVVVFSYKNRDDAYFIAFMGGIYYDLFKNNYLGVTSIFLILILAIHLQIFSRISQKFLTTTVFIFFTMLFYDSVYQFILNSAVLYDRSIVFAFSTTLFFVLAFKFINLIPSNLINSKKNEYK